MKKGSTKKKRRNTKDDDGLERIENDMYKAEDICKVY